MDIPGLSMRMAQSNLLTDVGTAISVNPGVGANIDISV